jgi:AraC family transcriptional regulator of adaptative response/methylated-DNA-[protein]-cysteine methyltransferase
MSDYDRIASAIAYIQSNVAAQPQLADIARHVHLSPWHFQRLFTRWAGTTPKRFLQVLTLELGKNLLERNHTLLDTAQSLGLSSTSRLHDHFVQLEAVTPGEYKQKGAGLSIHYGVQESLFGHLFVAQTPRGICRATFIEDADAESELTVLTAQWPQAQFVHDDNIARSFADQLFASQAHHEGKFKLHLNGTNFQLAVWRALLRIPAGTAVSYGELAAQLGSPKASRAVGTAVGANPVAFLIPCHRVIQQSGALGGYRWGLVRKQAIQLWERL